MKLKISMLAALLLAAFPFAAQAQDSNSYDSLKVSCESGAECNDFGVDFQEEGNEVAQTRRRRTRRTRRGGNDKKIYAGVTLGAFFPGELEEFDDDVVIGIDDDEALDPETSFGGSIYGGYKFTDLIGADAELFILGGDLEGVDDGGYTAVGFFTNARFTYALDQGNPRSIYGFLSPGIGFVSLGLNDEIDDVTLGDDTGTGFAIQAKAGVGYPVSDLIDIVGQVRYFNAFSVFEVGDEDQGFDAFSIEAGANLKF